MEVLSNLEKARLALVEADRASVLCLLAEQPATPEVLWLKAHAVEADDERLALLRQVSLGGHAVYAALAGEIVKREADFAAQIDRPPPYVFWRRPLWRRHRPLILALTVIILAAGLWGGQALPRHLPAWRTAALASATPTAPARPSATPLPPQKQAAAKYTAGEPKLLRVEYSTVRPVIFATTGSPATPAVGANFTAVEVAFTCKPALCAAPPEAELALQLEPGGMIGYAGDLRPVLTEYPAMPRAAFEQTVSGWFVFEVPAQSCPVKLLVSFDRKAPAL